MDGGIMRECGAHGGRIDLNNNNYENLLIFSGVMQKWMSARPIIIIIIIINNNKNTNNNNLISVNICKGPLQECPYFWRYRSVDPLANAVIRVILPNPGQRPKYSALIES